MPTFDYDRSQATAQRLIEKFGRAVTLVREATESGAEPWSPTIMGEATYETIAAVMEASQGMIDQFENSRSATLTAKAVRLLIMPGLGLPIIPDSGDIARFDGFDWTVFGCTPLAPGGIAVIYKVGVRR